MKNPRIINTKFWSDGFISELNPLDRYLFLYFLTNERTTLCGIYEIPLRLMSAETGLEVDMIQKMLKRLTGKIYYYDNYIILINFIKHQSLKSNDLKTGIRREFNEKPLKIRQFAVSKGYPIELIGIDKEEYPDTLPTPSPPSPDTPPRTKLNLTKLNKTKPNLNMETAIAVSENSLSKEINPIIDSFKEVNPMFERLFPNKAERSAAERLLKKFGKEKLANIIKYLPILNADKFAVKYHSYKPTEVERNIAGISAHASRNHVERSKPKVTKLYED